MLRRGTTLLEILCLVSVLVSPLSGGVAGYGFGIPFAFLGACIGFTCAMFGSYSVVGLGLCCYELSQMTVQEFSGRIRISRICATIGVIVAILLGLTSPIWTSLASQWFVVSFALWWFS